jgi:hypothetical protein
MPPMPIFLAKPPNDPITEPKPEFTAETINLCCLRRLSSFIS